jgi:hypothetical protein
LKPLSILLILFLISSCIPLRIAPKIKDDKVMIGKKFKRSLPRDYTFIFEDPKDADEFYNYINTKYQLKYRDVEWNVPLTIDNEKFFLSFYEVEIPTKTINLIPIIIDAKLEENGHDPILEDAEFSRRGKWYLALTITDVDMKDCLNPNYKSRNKVLKYLRGLRLEYLNTHNYLDALFRN